MTAPVFEITGKRIPLVVVVGPTAAGKTALSVALAEACHGEIISADSRQVYCGMDIGTAKATPEERARVPHHLVDVADPARMLSLAEYQSLAYAAIDDIHRRGALPMLVGGTGQYVRAVIEGWQAPEVAPRWELRAELAAEAERTGSQALHERLAGLDPLAASRIDHRNVRRVIRALEVCLVTGRRFSDQQAKSEPPFDLFLLGVTHPRAELYARIDQRVDRMLESGLVAEVRSLHERGLSWELPAMTGLGYRQMGEYLRGEQSLDEAAAAIKRQTRRFVQQQYNWFRLDDPAIYWVDPGFVPFTDVLARVLDWRASHDAAPRGPFQEYGEAVTSC